MEKTSTILCNVWLAGSNDFQQRVPDPAQAGIARTMEAILDPMNGQVYNEFTGLLGQIAWTNFHTDAFENPFKVFQKDPLIIGETTRNVAAKWIKAHAFNPCESELHKCFRPEYVEWYNSINYRVKYPWTISPTDLAQAVGPDIRNGDGYGLNMLILSTTQAAINSDNYDMMNAYLNLFTEADKRWGGLFKQKAVVPTDRTSGDAVLALMRSYANNLKFPSTLYNKIDVPVFVKPEECILFIEATAQAYVDVYALAPVFQIDKADIPYRIFTVPDGSLPAGAFAALTTPDFFEVRDSYYGILSFRDIDALVDQYRLHHQAAINASPHVPCILFGDFETTTTTVVTVAPTTLTITPAAAEVPAGGSVLLRATLAGTVDSANECGCIEVKPNACLYTVTGPEGVKLNARTYVGDGGVLHVQKTIAEGTKLTITAVSTYVNPTGETTPITAQTEITVGAPVCALSGCDCPPENPDGAPDGEPGDGSGDVAGGEAQTVSDEGFEGSGIDMSQFA